MGGYRYRLSKTIVPYAAVGVGHYAYSETSAGNDAGEDVAESRAGLVVLGGAEFRVHRWVGIGVDVQYTHVTGVLGRAGISQAFGEDDLGGTAARVRILAGR
jgi:opacity protein-like surface antigen